MTFQESSFLFQKALGLGWNSDGNSFANAYGSMSFDAVNALLDKGLLPGMLGWPPTQTGGTTTTIPLPQGPGTPIPPGDTGQNDKPKYILPGQNSECPVGYNPEKFAGAWDSVEPPAPQPQSQGEAFGNTVNPVGIWRNNHNVYSGEISYWTCRLQGGGSSSQDEKQPSEHCCSTIQHGFDLVADALNEINETLGKKFEGPCKTIEECAEKIISEINKRYSKIVKTCDQCKKMVADGLAGTLEYALVCAGRCIDETLCECSLSNPECEGKACKGCGKEPCCCVDGVCSPCPTPLNYYGWCSPSTGISVVNSSVDDPPGDDYVMVSQGGDPADVYAKAVAACQPSGTFPTIPTGPSNLPPINIPFMGTKSCDFNDFILNGTPLTFFNNKGNAALIGAMLDDSKRVKNAVMNSIVGLDPSIALVSGIWDTMYSPFTMAMNFGESLAQAIGCSDKRWHELYTSLAGMSFIEKSIGIDLSEYRIQYRYAMNSLCRQKYLGKNDAMAGFLAGAYEGPQLDALLSMEGYCPQATQWSIQAQRSKPVPLQLAMLRRRELYSESDYQRGMRELGYLDSDRKDLLYKLSEQIPTLTDIIRLMVRDADDEENIDWSESDELFTQKYGKQLKKWSQWQGIPEDFAKYAWRAHWTIPSPTQLFEFYHRLRDDEKFGGRDKMLADIKSALIQQDILPKWHDYYLAVSFHPLTRVDARRGFELGSLDTEQLRASFRDQGYSDENADILVKYSERRRKIVASGHASVKDWLKLVITRNEAWEDMANDGLPDELVTEVLDRAERKFIASEPAKQFASGRITAAQMSAAMQAVGVSGGGAARIINALSMHVTKNPALDLYKAGLIDDSAARINATTDGMNTAIIDHQIWQIDVTVDAQSAAACKQGIKRRFILGELDAKQVATELTSYGFTAKRTDKIVKAFQCERVALGKTIPAATLCKWLERGAITPQDFVERLVKIGYEKEDATLMVEDCTLGISDKRAKLEAKREKERQRKEEQEARAEERAANTTQKQIAAAQRASQAAAASRTAKNKMMFTAADAVAKTFQIEVFDAMEQVKALKRSLIENSNFSEIDALSILVAASKDVPMAKGTTYADLVTAVASGWEVVTIDQ